MILEKNFIQIQFDAAKNYIKQTESRYNTKAEELLASNAYIQGRCDAVADMESLVGQYNEMLKKLNKANKELDALKSKDDFKQAYEPRDPEPEGLGL